MLYAEHFSMEIDADSHEEMKLMTVTNFLITFITGTPEPILSEGARNEWQVHIGRCSEDPGQSLLEFLQSLL